MFMGNKLPGFIPHDLEFERSVEPVMGTVHCPVSVGECHREVVGDVCTHRHISQPPWHWWRQKREIPDSQKIRVPHHP